MRKWDLGKLPSPTLIDMLLSTSLQLEGSFNYYFLHIMLSLNFWQGPKFGVCHRHHGDNSGQIHINVEVTELVAVQ